MLHALLSLITLARALTGATPPVGSYAATTEAQIGPGYARQWALRFPADGAWCPWGEPRSLVWEQDGATLYVYLGTAPHPTPAPQTAIFTYRVVDPDTGPAPLVLFPAGVTLPQPGTVLTAAWLPGCAGYAVWLGGP